ncbi:MAG: 50S ribosome-binding GTPase, partial [Bdellovibrionales bacterium]|nr:50S ribosome-binding GTPase [Bdellovibrionales bacterium]
MSKRPPQIAILGRTNVGKSTLFNALCRDKERIVEDFAGVTRDRAHALVTLGDHVFTLVDTGGILGESEDPLAADVHVQSTIALEEAHIIIAILDGLNGLHPDDYELARFLRNSK